jgi:hypothetical protein
MVTMALFPPDALDKNSYLKHLSISYGCFIPYGILFLTKGNHQNRPLGFSPISYQNDPKLQKTAPNLFFVAKRDSFPLLFPFKNEKVTFD